MAPPPLPAVSTAPAAAVPSLLHSIERLTTFSDSLADFLGKWKSMPSLPDLGLGGPSPKPNPVAAYLHEQLLAMLNSALVGSTSVILPVVDRVAESNTSPSPVTIAPVNAVSTAAGFPVVGPVPESDPVPSVSTAVGLNCSPEPKPTAPHPGPVPNPAPSRDRRAVEPSAAELGNICKQMDSRALRRFVTVNLCYRSWLRRVGPGALRRALNPVALVLRAVSRYYICCDSENTETACVLLLELYVRAGCPRRQGKGEAELRAEAREAVLSWRSRIVQEKGRIANASIRDARGLILLMAALGVPAELPMQELEGLLFAGGGLQCAKVLKYSKLFVKKMRDVVVDMLNKGSYHEAIGVILAFELHDAFPLAGVITYMVEKVVHNRNEQKIEGLCNLAGSEECDEQELVLLRSISKYVDEQTKGSSEMFCSSIAERIKLLEERVGQTKGHLFLVIYL